MHLKTLSRYFLLPILMASSNAALAHYLDGRVYCDANGNGLIDSADFNISGAIVRADEASLGSFRGESMPPNGYYNVALPDGIYATYLASLEMSSLPADASVLSPENNQATIAVTPENVTPQQDWLINSPTLCQSPRPRAAIGDRVWLDTSGNGRQDENEAGVDGVDVALLKCGDDGQPSSTPTLVATTSTDSQGNYRIDNLEPGYYQLRFTGPTGYQFSAMNATENDFNDSDADTTGLTACTQLQPNEEDLSWDAGLILNPQTCNLSVTASATPNSVTVPVSDCDVLGKPLKLTFRYTGGGCSASDNAATRANLKVPTCSGTINTTLDAVVSASGKSSAYSVSPNLVAPGGTFTVTTTKKFDADSTFTLTNNASSEVHKIHTSCSTPLKVGDVFGSMTLVAFNDVQSTGSTVAVNYQVRNNGDALQGVTLLATPVGHNIDLGNLAANESRSISRDATINANTTITAAVTGTLSDGQICQATGTTTVTTVAPGGSNGGGKPCKKGDKKKCKK